MLPTVNRILKASPKVLLKISRIFHAFLGTMFMDSNRFCFVISSFVKLCQLIVYASIVTYVAVAIVTDGFSVLGTSSRNVCSVKIYPYLMFCMFIVNIIILIGDLIRCLRSRGIPNQDLLKIDRRFKNFGLDVKKFNKTDAWIIFWRFVTFFWIIVFTPTLAISWIIQYDQKGMKVWITIMNIVMRTGNFITDTVCQDSLYIILKRFKMLNKLCATIKDRGSVKQKDIQKVNIVRIQHQELVNATCKIIEPKKYMLIFSFVEFFIDSLLDSRCFMYYIYVSHSRDYRYHFVVLLMMMGFSRLIFTSNAVTILCKEVSKVLAFEMLIYFFMKIIKYSQIIKIHNSRF